MADYKDNLRRTGHLMEATDEEWEAYMCKYFSPHSPPILGAFRKPPTDPKDLGWKDTHRMDPYDPEPDA